MEINMPLCYQTLKTPAGNLYLAGTESHIHAIVFEKQWPALQKRFKDLKETETPVLREAKRQMKDYFSGTRKTFDLPLKMEGTPFQQRVWKALNAIPFGETRTYKQQAEAMKAPKAVRAVGRTNGLNLICIVIPCHRVVGTNGKLTGYAGGLEVKEFLLKLETTKIATPANPKATTASMAATQ